MTPMLRRWLPGGLLIVSGALASCQATEPSRPVAVIAQLTTNCPSPSDPSAAGERRAGATAFQRPADWATQLPGHPALSAWRVDFAAGESVVRVDAGAQPNPGYRLKLDEPPAVLDGEALRIVGVLERPPAGSLLPQVIAYPCVWLHLGPSGYRRVEATIRGVGS